MLHAMIMAGGGGTRFWPRSRAVRPKQFLTFSGNRTLLQSTVDRIAAQVPAERTWVLTSEQHRGEAVEQLKGMVPAEQVVGEPMGRDTAPCVALGAALVARSDRDATIMVMPADHLIEPEQEFRRAAHAAEQFANDFPDSLLTFGIEPTFPSTGYGYIHRGERAGTRQNVPISRAHGFREKPDLSAAEGFLASGDYFWNSGIFVWKPAAVLGQLEKRKPALVATIQKIVAAWGTDCGPEVFRTEYANAEKISIDYAVMQDAAKDGKVLVIHAPYKWDDVGSWLALERHNPQDADGNTVQGLHCGVRTSNCVIVSDPSHLIGTIGVENLVVVQCGNATLVTTRKGEADVKDLINRIKAQGLERFL
ncbi:mannose-1-phosphate guanylyltransferase [Gemmata sp.]|uniref:mannose-1-phosphate guanylyltransferase n=1 Tax=Gemmata sp. TaxID=1914242 RepID=UPI003F723F12